MSTDRQREIFAAYEAIESAEPDISTERLLCMAANQCGCEIDDVCRAILTVGREMGLVKE